VIPAEIGIAPAEPALVVPLAGASGKTFRVDDLTIEVREFQVDGTGLAHIKLTVRIEGERGAEKAPKAVLSARAMNVLNHQLELTTERGKLLVASGGASATGPVLAADYTYRTPDGTDRRNPPAVQLRVYTPRWVAWDVPFEFGDLPLP
jgi:hypothetical protein